MKYILSLLIPAFLVSPLAAAPVPSPVLPSGFGVNIKATKWSGADLDQLDEAGFRVVRYDLHWHVVEKEKGVYDFSRYDDLVASMGSRKVKILFILCYGNPHYDEFFAPYTDEGRAAFTRFAAAAVKRYRGRDFLWELWNEPNNPKTMWKMRPGDTASTAVRWAELAKVAIPAIRSAAPGEFIIGPGIENISEHMIEWLEEAAKTGGLTLLDGLSFHIYNGAWQEKSITDLSTLRAFLKRIGFSKPILCSETGKSISFGGGVPGGRGEQVNGTRWRHVSLDQQASWLIRSYLYLLSQDVPLQIWYVWPEEGGFGVLDKSKQPKPAYHAARAMNATLSGYRLKARIPLSTRTQWLLEFERVDGKAGKIFAAWLEENEAPGEREVPVSEAALVLDLYGNTNAVSGKRLRITQEPQYILDSAAAAVFKPFPVLCSIQPYEWVVLPKDDAAQIPPDWATKNGIENTNFTGDLKPWNIHVSGQAAWTAQSDNAVHHGGGSSLRIENASPLKFQVYGRIFQEVGGLQPDTTYVVRAWVKGNGVGKGHLGNWNKRKALPTGDYDWTQIEVRLRTAPDSTTLLVQILVESETKALWVSDVSLSPWQE